MAVFVAALIGSSCRVLAQTAATAGRVGKSKKGQRVNGDEEDAMQNSQLAAP